MTGKSNEWLARRKTGIGGSDVAAVLGLSPWKTPLGVWMDKTGRSDQVEETEAMYWGNVLEDIVAREFARRHEVKIEKRNKLFRHAEHACLVANIDRWIVGGEILECKTSGWARDWGEDGDNVPFPYLCQVAHYMNVLDVPAAWIAVLIGGNKYRDYHIPRNERLEQAIVTRCVEFWNRHVIADIPPPPQSLADVEALYREGGSEGSVIAPAEIEAAVYDLARRKLEIKELAELAESLEMQIKAAIGESSELVAPDGSPLATWKKTVTRRLDSKSLKNDLPDIAGKYTTETESRRFLVKLNPAKNEKETTND